VAPAPGRSDQRGRPGPSLAATVAAVALSALCSVLLLWPQHGRALNWDEVDYVSAAREGVVTNLWERGSLSVPAYVRFAYDKVRHREPHLPAGYQEAEDPFRLRHGHSPVAQLGRELLGRDRLRHTDHLGGTAEAVADERGDDVEPLVRIGERQACVLTGPEGLDRGCRRHGSGGPF